jgi:ActR/RegA family two-component response regulator
MDLRLPSPDEDGPDTNGSRCVLLVDDDRYFVDTLNVTLRSMGAEVVSALSGKEALEALHSRRFDLLLLELHLADIPGLDVVRSMHAEGLNTAFAVLSGHATIPLAVEAMVLGAVDVIEKPVGLDKLRALICQTILRNSTNEPPPSNASGAYETPASDLRSSSVCPATPHTPLERWHTFVVRLVTAQQDLKSMDAWAKHLGVSRSVLSECCRLVNVAPHDARDFARMLRAISRCGREWKPETVLDVADSRTLKKLETRAGLKGGRGAPTPTIEQFLGTQQWIPGDNATLRLIRFLPIEQR